MNNQNKELPVENSINKKILRFKYCDDRFYPYIEKVLKRLPEDICFKNILDDLSLEIISFSVENSGQFFDFLNQVKDLVVLNESILNYPEFHIIHVIVHELAHKVAREGKTGLYEKEAEELLQTWGFEKESEVVGYINPIFESEGYKCGYKWAIKQKDLSIFEEFYYEWDEGRLTGERLEMLYYTADATSFLVEEMGSEKKESEPEEQVFHDRGFRMERGVIWGIMGVLKERKEREKERFSHKSGGENEVFFIETLEKVSSECNKLWSTNQLTIWNYRDKYPEVKQFFDSIDDLNNFLNKLKEKGEGE